MMWMKIHYFSKFSDRISAYDVKFNQDIPKKGEVLCRFAEFWFNKLDVSKSFHIT